MQDIVPPSDDRSDEPAGASTVATKKRGPILAGRYVPGVRFGYRVHPNHAEKGRQPVRIKGAGVDLHFAEMPNPYYSKAHDGDRTNPKMIVVARNGNESPLVRLEKQGVMDARQTRAGHLFRSLFERLMAGQASPSALQERVDGGGAPDIFTETRFRAGVQLRQAAAAMTEDQFAVLRFVCGEGHSLRELSRRLGLRYDKAKGMFLAALDRYAEYNGFGKPVPQPVDAPG